MIYTDYSRMQQLLIFSDAAANPLKNCNHRCHIKH